LSSPHDNSDSSSKHPRASREGYVLNLVVPGLFAVNCSVIHVLLSGFYCKVDDLMPRVDTTRSEGKKANLPFLNLIEI
jgi:hypothetical protein